MQTFLPYRDFRRSAEVLDPLRLGKQRVEAYQILRTLLNESNGWRNHPAVQMWKGYELALSQYALAVCDEWQKRGYKDSVRDKVENLCVKWGVLKIATPPFLGNEEFHRSHQSNLLRKDPEHYSQFGWEVPDNLPYVWEVR